LRTITVRKALEYINNYSLAATAKDCSIMITLFSNSNKEVKFTDDSHGTIADGRWCYRVAIIDTDKKQPEHIPHYYHMDQKIVNNFIDLVKHETPKNRSTLSCCDKH